MQSESLVKPTETASLAVLPSNLDEHQATIWTLLMVLLRAVKQIQIELGESVLVSGNGLVGQVMAQLASIAGAGRVVGLAAGSVQADDTRVAWITELDKVEEHLPQGQADLLIETTNDLARLEKLLACVRGGGRILLLGSSSASQANFDFYPHLHRRSLTLKSITLQAALAEPAPIGPTGEREIGFMAYLLESGRLNLVHPDLISNPITREQLVSAPLPSGLLIEWNHDNSKH